MWCGYKQDPTQYKHANLPYGKDLHGDDLYTALEDLFGQYYNDEVVAKLAPVANSQRNESFNSVVGSKAPKIRCYGGSESNDFRVACAVAQTNTGHGYVNRTLEALGIEPGRNCIKYNLEMDKRKNNDNQRKKTIKFKKRRNQLHSRRISHTARKEKKEGKTYESNIGLTLNQTFTVNPIAEEVHDVSNVSEEIFKKYESTASPFTPRHSIYSIYICTVLIGHNAKRFDIPVLLRNSTSGFHEKLKAMGVLFGDSLSLFEQVVSSNHPALQQPDGKISATNQSALYKCLFAETFEAHDALEDVTALRKMMFSSKLKLSEKLIVTHCKLISCHDALQNLCYLDRRHELMKTFESKLYSRTGDGVITKSMAEKIAGSGLTYDDLLKLFTEFGREGLIAILSNPPTTNKESNRPRVTKTARILTAVLHHFEEKHPRTL